MKTTLKKRLTSAFLVLTMLFSYLPAGALALGDWGGSDDTLHIESFKINTDGSWEVTFGGKANETDTGALAILPNFRAANGDSALGSYRESVGGGANTSTSLDDAVKGFVDTSLAIYVVDAAMVKAGQTYTSSNPPPRSGTDSGSSLGPVNTLAQLQSKYSSGYYPGGDVGDSSTLVTGSSGSAPESFPFIAVFVAGSAIGTPDETRSFYNATMEEPGEAELTATPIEFVFDGGTTPDMSLSTPSSTIENIGNGDANITGITYDATLSGLFGTANSTFGLQLPSDAGTTNYYTTGTVAKDGSTGDAVTATFNVDSSVGYTAFTGAYIVQVTGYITVTYTNADGSDTRTLLIPVTLKQADMPGVLGDPNPMEFTGTVEYDSSGNPTVTYTGDTSKDLALYLSGNLPYGWAVYIGDFTYHNSSPNYDAGFDGAAWIFDPGGCAWGFSTSVTDPADSENALDPEEPDDYQDEITTTSATYFTITVPETDGSKAAGLGLDETNQFAVGETRTYTAFLKIRYFYYDDDNFPSSELTVPITATITRNVPSSQIKFDVNGGKWSDNTNAQKTADLDSSTNKLLNGTGDIPANPIHTDTDGNITGIFGGWTTSSTGTTALTITNDTVFTPGATLYALWLDPVALIFHANAASVSESDSDVTGMPTATDYDGLNPYDTSNFTPVAQPSNPSLPNYAFKGWAYSDTATTPNVTWPLTASDITGHWDADHNEVHLYAIWEELPKIDDATLTGTVKPSTTGTVTATLDDIILISSTGSNSTLDAATNVTATGPVIVKEWWIGGVGGNSTTGPTLKQEPQLPTTDGTNIAATIPQNTDPADRIWVLLAGDGVNVHSDEVWVSFEMGVNKLNLIVDSVVFESDGTTPVSTTPSNITVSGSASLKVGDSPQTISTTSTNTDYEFLGWTLDPTVSTALLTNPYTHSTSSVGWTLSGTSLDNPAASGMNTATFSIPSGATIPDSGADTEAKIYAVYKAKPKAKLTVGVLLRDANGDFTTTDAPTVTVSNTKPTMFAGETSTIIAPTAPSGYIFVGWATTADSSQAFGTTNNIDETTGTSLLDKNTPATGATTATYIYTIDKTVDAKEWTLDASVTPGVNGNGTGTFTMSATPEDAYIYAIYAKIPTYPVTIALGTGISSAVVTVTRDGTTTSLGTLSSTGTTSDTYQIYATDIVTVVSTAANYYDPNGFEPNTTTTPGVPTGLTYNSYGSDTLVFSISDAAQYTATTIKAISKAEPADLTLTAVPGNGTTTSVTIAPAVTIQNIGGQDATSVTTTIKSVTLDGNTDTTNGNYGFTAPTHPGTVTASGSHTATIGVPTDGSLTQGKTYVITLTVSYVPENGATAVTQDIVVSYTVKAEFTGTVTVKLDDATTGVASTATVTLSGGGNTYTDTVDTNAKAEFTGLDGTTTYSITVDLDGSGSDYSPVTITPDKVSNSSKEVEVNFYTVTVSLNNGTTENAAVANTGDKVTLEADSKSLDITSSNISSGKVELVVQSGTYVSIEATPSNAVYAFDKWTLTVGSASATNPTSSSHTFQVNGTTTAVAHLKEAATPAVLTYMGNGGNAPDVGSSPVVGNVPTALVSTVGATATLSSTEPTLPGYVFKGWATIGTATAPDSDYAPGSTVKLVAASAATGANNELVLDSNNQVNLYAVWESATITFTPTLSDGVYGTYYSNGLSATSSDLGAVQFSATGLPGGLGISGSSVSGTPYEVGVYDGGTGNKAAVKLTATLVTDYHDANHKVKAEVATTMTVAKATPTVTSVVISNAVIGQNINTAEYTVTVVGPMFTGAASNGGGTATPNNPSDDAWTTRTETLVYKTTSGTFDKVANGAVGTVAFSNNNSNIFADTNDGKTVKADFTAYDTVDTTNFPEGNGQAQDAVWNDVSGTGTAAFNNETSVIKVSAGTTFNTYANWTYEDTLNTDSAGLTGNAHKNYTVNANGTDGFVVVNASPTNDTVNPKQFSLKAEGTLATGTLTYTLAKGNDSGFTFTTTAPTTSVASGSTINFTVQPKAGLDVGTYTDVLTITGANGGSAVVFLTFVVEAAKTFDATITVKYQDVTDTTTTGGIPGSVEVVVGGTTLDSSSTNNGTDGQYTVTLTVGSSYPITVNGTGGGSYTTSLVVDATKKTATVTLYEVTAEAKTTDTAAITTAPAQTGEGWYVDGQYATLGTASTAAVNSDTYNFKIWQKQVATGSTAANGASAANDSVNTSVTAQITAPAIFTANYEKPNAATATLTFSGGTDATGNPPAPQTHNVGTVVTLPNQNTLVNSGHVFKGWSTTDDGSVDYAVGASYTLSATATLYAVWDELVFDTWTVDPPDGIYGVAYSYQVPAPTFNSGTGATFIFSVDATDSLPGGLYIDENTGLIYGQPYEVGANQTVKITATHATDSSLSKTVTVDITIEKYTLQLTNTQVTGVVDGANISTGSYQATVVNTAPFLIEKGTSYATDKWGTITDAAIAATGNAANVVKGETQPSGQKGTLDASATPDTFADGRVITLTYNPSTATGTGNEDGHGQSHATIYEPAEGTVTVNGGSATYDMTLLEGNRTSATAAANITMQGPKVGTNAPDGFVADVGYTVVASTAVTDSDADGSTTSNEIQAQLFTLTNLGNQSTGTLTYRFGTASGAGVAGKYFAIATGDFANTVLDAADTNSTGDEMTFTVVPVVSTPKLEPGTYTDTLVITNAKGYSVSVVLTLTVEAANYTVTVNTYHRALNATIDTLQDLAEGSVVLKSTDGTANDVPLTGASGVYTGSAVYNKTYYVVVNGYTLPNVIVSNSNDQVDVYLKQVVTAKDDPAGATDAPTVKNSAGVTATYIVSGDLATITADTANDGYTYKELQDTTDDTDPSTTHISKTLGLTYTTAINEPVEFTAVYVQGFKLIFDGNGATSGTAPATQTHPAGTDVTLPGQNTLVKTGYVFKGWSTHDSNDYVSGTSDLYPAGSTFTTPDPGADTTLYAVWEPADSGLTLSDETITVYYGEGISNATLADNVSGLTTSGSATYEITTTLDTTTGSPPPLNDTVAPVTWSTKLTVNQSTGDISGTTALSNVTTANGTQFYAPGPFPITVQVEDDANGNKATGTLTVKVEQAWTEIVPNSEPALNSGVVLYPGGTFALSDILDSNTGKVDAMLSTANPGGSHIIGQPSGNTVLQADIPGTWTLADGSTSVTIGQSGTQTIKLKFTPYDNGFKPVEYDLTVTVVKIASVDVKLTFPVTGVAASNTGTINGVTFTTTPTTTVNATDAVEVTQVSWTGLNANNEFDLTNNSVSAIVTVKTKDGWTFDEGLTGTYTDTGSGGTETVTVLSVSPTGDSAVLMYTWAKADQAAQNIRVNVTEPIAASTPNATATPTGTPLGSFNADEDVRWVKASLSAVDSTTYAGLADFTNPFEAGQTYVAIVTVEVNDGYFFTAGSLAALNGSNDYAKINNYNAKVLSVTPDATDSTKATKAVIAVEFTVADSTIVGIDTATAGLVYYVNTETALGSSNDGHYNASATGHNTYGFVMDKDTFVVKAVNNLGATPSVAVSDFQVFVDTNNSGSYDTGDTEITFNSDNEYTFTSNAWDGMDLYVIYAPGGVTSTISRKVGTLVVKPLTASSITGGTGWSVDSNDEFVIPTTLPTANVTFNTGDPMGNTVLDLPYAERGTVYGLEEAAKSTETTSLYRPNFYYMLDANGDNVIDATTVSGVIDSELKNGDDVSTHNGKAVYACYTDVNGNLVYTKVGVIGVSFTVTITDENGHDPEYADKLTATPSGDPDDYYYQWQVKDPSTGDWTPISGATSPDFRPDKEHVGETIRVVVTDRETGTEVVQEHITGTDPIEIKPRSLNFIVDVKDKKYDGNKNNYWEYNQNNTSDFHPTRVEKEKVTDSSTGTTSWDTLTTPYGGVWGNDVVTISPVTGGWNDSETTRPSYANENVGSEITWPEVSVDTTATTSDKTGGYTLGGTDANYYRLVAQDKQDNRGEITDGTVTHVDVSFKEVPTFDHAALPVMGVTDSRETQAGEYDGVNNTDQTYTATWYRQLLFTDFASFDPSTTTLTPWAEVGSATTKYEAGYAYAVVVQVKPQDGYRYDDDATKFYFHFGTDQHIEVDLTTTGGNSGVMKGTVNIDGTDETVYYMWYTFSTVAFPKIAHVNVSVPQPVVGKEPCVTNDVSKIQVLGSDGSDRTNDVDVANVTWKDGSGTTITAPTTFQTGTVYTVEFDLSTLNNYRYMNDDAGDASDVSFVVSGVGPIVGAGTDSNNVITSVVTTATDANNKYHVVVTYEKLTGGTVDLTDVYVDASIPAAGGDALTGPEVGTGKPYELATGTGINNKWYYWNSTTWVEVDATNHSKNTDNEFLAKPGTHYRVTATVKLTTDGATKYTLSIGDTTFYLAGDDRTTGVTELNGITNAGDVQLKDNGDGTFALIREFSVPSDIVNVMDVIVTYPNPVADSEPKVNKSGADLWTYLTLSGGVIDETLDTSTATPDKDTLGTTWSNTALTAAPTGIGSFTASGALTGNFTDGKYYMVQATIEPETGKAFVLNSANAADNTRVSINDVLVNVGGGMGIHYNSKGEAIGWAYAKADGNNIIAYYIAKTDAVNRIIKEVTGAVTAPSDGGTPATDANVSGTVNTDDQNVSPSSSMADTTPSVTTWEVYDGTSSWSTHTGAFAQGGVYRATFELEVNAAGGYSYRNDTTNNAYVTFNINGVTVTATNTSGTVAGTTTATDDTKVTVTRKGNTGTDLDVYTVVIEFPAIGEDEKLLAVTVNYTAPVSGANPDDYINYTPTDKVDLNATLLTSIPTTATAAGTGSVWYAGKVDKNTSSPGTALTTSDTFGSDEYTVVTVFTAKDGVQFNNATKFIVNGTTYTAADTNNVNVVLLDSNKTAVVYHTFAGLDKEVVKVVTAVTAPVAGATAQSTASTTLAANVSNVDLLPDALLSNGAASVLWYETGDTSKTAVTSFGYSTSYTAEFTLTVNDGDGYSYRGSTDFVDFVVNSLVDKNTTTKTALNVKSDTTTPNKTDTLEAADGTKVTVTRDTGDLFYTVVIEFPTTGPNPVPNDDKIQHVYLQVAPPVMDGDPTASGYDKATVTSVISAQGTAILTSNPLNDLTPMISWTCADGTAMGATFESGKKYMATISGIDDANGWTFATDPAVDFSANGSILLKDGETATTTNVVAPVEKVEVEKVTDDNSGNVTYTVKVTFKPLEDKLTLDVHGVVTPVPEAGKAPSTSPITAQPGAPYTADSTGWYSDAGCNSAFTGNFVAGVTYYAKLTVKLNADATDKYQFSTDTKGYMNNNAANGATGSGTETILNADGTVTVIYPFTVGKQAVVVHVGDTTTNANGTANGTIPVATTNQADVDAINALVGIHEDYAAADAGKYTLSHGGSVFGQWYEDENGNNPATTFVAGNTYYLITTVKPEPGYSLTDNVADYVWVDNSQIAMKVTPTRAQGSDEITECTVVFKYRIPKDGEVTISVVPGNAHAPVTGDPLNSNGWTSEYFNVVSGPQVTWYKGSLDETTVSGASPVTGTADASTTYTAVITVKPKDGYVVGNNPTYMFNDKDITGQDVLWTENGNGTYTLYYHFTTGAKQTITVTTGGGGGGTTVVETPVVTYALRELGVTEDLTAEKVNKNSKPKAVPDVTGISGLVFVGWSETNPATLKDGELPTLVDPTTVKITDDKTFYAVYEKVADEFDHLHYVIGFPDGTFGPDHNITRGQVATIIARACLDNFIEGSDYGNPGNYTDVADHWAYSAISYCSLNGVFAGYEDGTFRPDRYITRQELATVVARLAGVQVNQGLPFSDSGDIASWAVNGVYTNYANGWVNGYTDGTFRPLNDITRAETVKIFNGYLLRGTDKEGLSQLHEYIHTGVASNNTQNDQDEYMTWPDVPKTHWAYYEVIEAANDHNFYWRDTAAETPPEDWYECYIDEKWRYQDDENDGADDVGRDNTLPVFTVTYTIKSNGVVWQSITEQVTKYQSPSVDKLPKAEPSEGYRFAGWSETDPDTGVVTIIDPTAHPVLEDRTFYAVFEPEVPAQLPQVTITYVIGDHGTTGMALTETIEMYQSPTVANLPQITADAGWRFAGWSETDPATGTVTSIDPTAHPALTDRTFYAVYVRPNYIGGYEDNTFRPDEALTRAVAATILAGLKGYDPNTAYDAPAFSDLAGHWAANAIAFCVSQGLLSGYEDNTFRPDDPISRQEFAVVMTRLDGQTQSGELTFTDTGAIADWARNSVYTAYTRGWIGGYEDGTFLPERNVTRAEAVKMFNAYLGRSADRASIESQSGYTVWSDVPTTHWAYYEIIEATNTWNQ